MTLPPKEQSEGHASSRTSEKRMTGLAGVLASIRRRVDDGTDAEVTGAVRAPTHAQLIQEYLLRAPLLVLGPQPLLVRERGFLGALFGQSSRRVVIERPGCSRSPTCQAVELACKLQPFAWLVIGICQSPLTDTPRLTST